MVLSIMAYRSYQFLTILLISLLWASNLQAGSINPSLTTLFQLIEQRLALMQPVAIHKWRNNQSIEDLQREKIVIDRALNSASDLGLDRIKSHSFFVQQIDSAKAIQSYWFAEWRLVPPDTSTDFMDLNTMIRPGLITLGDQILAQIALIQNNGSIALQATNLADFKSIVQLPGLAPEQVASLFTVLSALVNEETSQASSVLKRVRSRGLLRIGTTGDYQPFSYREQDRLTGIDIELGKQLAESLGVPFEFVETSWPDLMSDLGNDRFDIAMSGISWSAERNREAFFSIAYHLGGKTAIARCEDRQRFTLPADMDQVDVRIIVNPGGTNQHYVNEHIHKASIRVFPDNVQIFKEIVKGNADLMITDAVEVRLQSALNRALCPVISGMLLTHLEKAWLLPADIEWKRVVDNWLHSFRQETAFMQIFRDHLSAQ